MSEMIEAASQSSSLSTSTNSLNNRFWITVDDSKNFSSLFCSTKLSIERKDEINKNKINRSLTSNIEQQQQIERRVHWNPFLVQLLRSSSPLNNLRCVLCVCVCVHIFSYLFVCECFQWIMILINFKILNPKKKLQQNILFIIDMQWHLNNLNFFPYKTYDWFIGD